MSPIPIEKVVPVADAPIDKVTVFQSDRAEITRCFTVDFDEAGHYEVKLQGLPHTIDSSSVRLEAQGECTVQHVSYSEVWIEKPKEAIDETGVKAQITALQDRLTELTEQHTAVAAQQARGQELQVYLRTYTATVVAPPRGAADKPADLKTVRDVLSFAREQLAEADAEKAKLDKQGRAIADEITSVKAQLAALNQSTARANTAGGSVLTRQAVISLDVPHEGSVELEVRYVASGASWSSSYDVGIATTQQHAVTCIYYGEVRQGTGEDWSSVSLTLSTAEPAIAGTPPVPPLKTVGWKRPPAPIYYPQQQFVGGRGGAVSKGSARKAPALTALGTRGYEMPGDQCEMMAPSCAMSMSAPPPPPAPAAVATAGVIGGGGGSGDAPGGSSGGSLGAVAYQLAARASVKSDRSMQKLTVGVLELAAEVTHYVVPSLGAAAYLKAKAVNVTDYLLLASDDVSIFFDNRFVTKTTLRPVSPGESFDVFLGIDPAVKVVYSPPRKTSRKRGTMFTKSQQAVTHTHSTTLTNSKAVPIVVALVDTIPRSSEDLIKVTLKQPALVEQLKLDDTDESLVSAALELAGVTTNATTTATDTITATAAAITAAAAPSPAHSTASSATGTAANAAAVAVATVAATAGGVLKVVQSELGKTVWIVRVLPHSEQRVPFEYTVEWPADKEITVE